MSLLLAADIGSTWTKAVLVETGARDRAPRVTASTAVPTTQDELARGLEAARSELAKLRAPGQRPDEVRFTSSAKGGLAIAAVGLVPDLTVKVARLAAASAGGKIVASYGYRLAKRQVGELERLAPDVLLLCGGTDGGDTATVVANARALAASRLSCAILYAGNAGASDDIREILAAKDLAVVANLMPEVGTLSIEPVRATIRETFLRRIVEGRGLGEVSRKLGCSPKPTPLAVYELVEALVGERPDMDDLVLVDMGGATTDVYSSTESFRETEGVFLRGIREPRLTRTVEGDLGMRVSAASASAATSGTIDELLSSRGVARPAFDAWIAEVHERPETLPRTAEERVYDEVLACACLAHALLRHAGTAEEAWTPQGKVTLQRGKDLRAARRLVASGGFLPRLAPSLSCADLGAMVQEALAAARRAGGPSALLPDRLEALSDCRCILPMLASLAADHPAEAAALVMENLS